MSSLLKYSNNDIERAGNVIAAGKLFAGEPDAETKQAFLIANNWREAHDSPMRSIHASVRAYMRVNQMQGFTAARLKRMPAIRRKLHRIGLGLDQIQDIGGCRVVLPSIEDVHNLTKILKERLPSRVLKEDPYIENLRGIS